jgi:beta-lactamase regulating signal transducer with metallopeptidase domain
MADPNSSVFLQSLGWATLNSFWQMALLWCFFLVINHFLKLSSNKKYLFSVYSIGIGFAWFVHTFVIYFLYEANQGSILSLPFSQSVQFLPAILTSASLAYLCLIIVPTYKIVQNWRFLQLIKSKGLEKAPYYHRLFVQKIGSHLGIHRKVKIYISQLVKSPVTIGYLKPIILLPVAALNNLTTQQVEAILLHELSHIKRYDYLVNLFLTIIHVILYFNPFVKLFLKKAELERENCCDEMVLQFEYDKISYATALLQIEKSSQLIPVLAMGAAGKKHLLSRIEKIVGVYKKPAFNTTHFAASLCTLFLLFMVNAVIITGKQKLKNSPLDYLSAPYAFFVNDDVLVPIKAVKNNVAKMKGQGGTGTTHSKNIVQKTNKIGESSFFYSPSFSSHEAPAREMMQVSFDETDASLSTEEKQEVSKTIEKTKKVLKTQWKEVEKSIADVMTADEKVIAKQEYLTELEKVDWTKMEKNLKASFEHIDWEKINSNLNEVLTSARLDSLQNSYSQVLTQINKTNSSATKPCNLAIPDASVHQLQKAKVEVQLKLDELKKLRVKKIVRL